MSDKRYMVFAGEYFDLRVATNVEMTCKPNNNSRCYSFRTADGRSLRFPSTVFVEEIGRPEWRKFSDEWPDFSHREILVKDTQGKITQWVAYSSKFSKGWRDKHTGTPLRDIAISHEEVLELYSEWSRIPKYYEVKE